MAEFKINIGDKNSKKTYKLELKSSEAESFFNKKLGDKIRGELIGLNGYELQITGGSDNAGFPMISSISGTARKKVILSKGKGFKKTKRAYSKKRKTIRGNIITPEIAQINLKVVKKGKDSIAKLLGLEAKPEENKEEAKSEEKPKQETKSE